MPIRCVALSLQGTEMYLGLTSLSIFNSSKAGESKQIVKQQKRLLISNSTDGL